MDISQQLERGWIVCPVTRAPLGLTGTQLQTTDGRQRYPIKDGVPLLLADHETVEQYVNDSPAMVSEYESRRGSTPGVWRAWRERLEAKLNADFRTGASIRAFASLFDGLPSDALCLNIGGGPNREHPALINLNVGPFPNVDIVGDAHRLPYRDACVDRISCQAVLEHLREPSLAAREMFRVLKPEGKVFAATPFLQAYHGYPNHFQNFTLSGHRLLFENEGFQILESGSCVGPMVAMWDLATMLLRSHAPARMRGSVVLAWRALGLVVRPMDRFLGTRSNAHELASTTYVVAQKPR